MSCTDNAVDAYSVINLKKIVKNKKTSNINDNINVTVSECTLYMYGSVITQCMLSLVHNTT